MYVVHRNTLSDGFRIRIVWFQPKQDSDRIRISFFKNRIGSDSKIRYLIISGMYAPVLPTLGFSPEFGLIFCGVECFSEDLRVTCFSACFNWHFLVFWACFLQISVLRMAFHQILWHFCCFSLLLQAHWSCFYENLLILGLFFQTCLFAFLFNVVADFSFCWIFLPTHVGPVFRWNYLFLACFSNLLACFCKIAWHHWYVLQLRIFEKQVSDPAFQDTYPLASWWVGLHQIWVQFCTDVVKRLRSVISF